MQVPMGTSPRCSGLPSGVERLPHPVLIRLRFSGSTHGNSSSNNQAVTIGCCVQTVSRRPIFEQWRLEIYAVAKGSRQRYPGVVEDHPGESLNTRTLLPDNRQLNQYSFCRASSRARVLLSISGVPRPTLGWRTPVDQAMTTEASQRGSGPLIDRKINRHG